MKLVVLSLLLSICPRTAEAYCDEFIYDGTTSEFEYSYVCENTFSLLEYKIIRRYTFLTALEFLHFDPKGINLLCTKFDLDEETAVSSCRDFGQGRQSFKRSKKNSGASLSIVASEELLLKEFSNMSDQDFNFPTSSEALMDYNCFVTYDSGQIILAVTDANLGNLSECLLRLEVYFTENKIMSAKYE